METQQTRLLKEEDGHELFRRAIVERDDDAWAAAHARYRPLLITWVHKSSLATQIGEYYDDIADQAFARAWSALSPTRFGEFPTLSQLLGYLRTCVAAVMIDHVRAKAARARALQRLEVGTAATPEQIVLAKMGRGELWRFVSALAETEQERMVLLESFVLDLPPRTIQARHRDLFASTPEVYAAKRNLIARLQRNQALQQFCREMHSA